jgi:protein phosphatase
VGDPWEAGERDASGGLEWPGFLLAVADGMGGQAAGEIASRLAVEGLAEELGRRAKGANGGALVAVDVGKDSIHAANARIRETGERDASLSGMGTTLTVAWVLGSSAELFQVGDSRAYLWRGGRLEQLTKDQSLIGKLVEDGLLSPEQAETAAGRHIILQALGSEEALDIVHRTVALQAGDLLLLCTDGLSGLAKHSAIETVMRRGGTLAEQAAKLVKLAEDAGGTDNITVLLAKVSPAYPTGAGGFAGFLRAGAGGDAYYPVVGISPVREPASADPVQCLRNPRQNRVRPRRGIPTKTSWTESGAGTALPSRPWSVATSRVSTGSRGGSSGTERTRSTPRRRPS